MNIAETFALYAVAAFLWLAIGFGFGWVFGHTARQDDHTQEDDAEQADYLLRAIRDQEARKRVKAYPITESKS